MKALFLDTDGVLQPVGGKNRFEHRDEKVWTALFPLDDSWRSAELQAWREKYVD